VHFIVPFATDSELIGREVELERLHNRMKSGATRFRRAALVGMGGIGKTQLAVEYARRHRKEYPGGIYWVNAAAPLVAELATLAERLDLREEPASEAERPGRRLRAFERHLHENPNALVIFDNLADPLALREPTAGVVLWELPCHMLFTTRRRETDAPFETISVGALPENAALHLLLASNARRALLDGGREDELQAAKAICRALGHLPLAIVLASKYLGKSSGRSLTLFDYLQRLRREGGLATADAVKVAPARLATQHDAAVTATLRNQWDALGTTDARHTLQVAALLRNSARVSRAMLAHLTGLSNESKDGYLPPLEEALSELLEWSLVEELTEETIRLHPLVREFAASRIEDREAFAAACAKRLGKVLGEMGQIEKEVRTRGLDAVLADLRLGEELGGAGERELFRRLLRPLDREAHCLRAWDHAREPAFFLQQVRNISFELGLQDVQEQAEAALRARGLPYLRERLRTSQESESLVRTLVGHTSSVWGVALIPDGRSALSASHDGTLKTWDLASGSELRTLPGHASPVNGVAVTPNGQRAVSASEDGTLKVWDLGSGREVRTLLGHASSVNSVVVTPNGQRAISASTDTTLKVWDLESGREVRTLEGHTLTVNGVVVMPGGSQAISASDDCTLKVWDLDSGREVLTLAGHTESVMGVAVTPNARFVVSASTDKTLKVWDLRSGLEVHTLKGHTDWVTGVAVTPDGTRIISASRDGTLKVWDLASGCELHTLEGHIEPVKDVTVTPDGRFAVSASIDNTLKVWDLGSGREVRTQGGHLHDVPRMAMTSDGRFAISVSRGGTLKVWKLPIREHIYSLEGQASPATPVAVTPDGRLAITTSEDQTPKVWDLENGRALFALAGHTWGVTAFAIAPHRRLAITASPDKTLKVWDLVNGDELFTLEGHTGGVTAVAVTPDERWAISASEDTTLKVWDLASGRERCTLAGHAGGVTAVVVTPDGRSVISASEDKTLKTWDLETGRETNTFTGHTNTVNGVAIAPDGTFIISTSEDTTLRVWDLAGGCTTARLKASAPLLSCAVAPDGCTFLTVDAAGSLHILDWVRPSMDVYGPRNARVVSGSLQQLGGSPSSRLTKPVSGELSPHSAPRSLASSGKPSPIGNASFRVAFPGAGAHPRSALANPPVSGTAVSRAQPPTTPAVTTHSSLEVRIGESPIPIRPRPAAGRIKILFLASNPMSMDQLQFTREARQIEERLGVGRSRDVFTFVAKWAVRRGELQRLLLEEKPHVLHFSGYGSTRAQLLLEDDDGNAAPIEKKGLVDLIGILKHRLRLVVLNGCNTEPLASALVQHVAFAIGMRRSIDNNAAIAFAVSFYQAIAFDEPVPTAFLLARNELVLQQLRGEQTPTLKMRKGVDASTLLRGDP
jgi:WD40 repeat protein